MTLEACRNLHAIGETIYTYFKTSHSGSRTGFQRHLITADAWMANKLLQAHKAFECSAACIDPMLFIHEHVFINDQHGLNMQIVEPSNALRA